MPTEKPVSRSVHSPCLPGPQSFLRAAQELIADGRGALARLKSAAGAAITETVNLYDAKTNYSKLVERAAAGEKIVIANAAPPATTKPPETSSPLSTSPPLPSGTIDDTP